MHVILLAKTTDNHSEILTLNALKTLHDSNSSGKIKTVTVVENSLYNWFDNSVIYNNTFNFKFLFLSKNEQFNYNAFLNYGINFLKTLGIKEFDYIACCNNDLEFDYNWLSILEYNYPSMSPKCSLTASQKDFKNNSLGYRTAKELAGWCIVLKLSTWEKINGFDASVSFWCSDDAYRMQLIENKLEHWLIPESVVNHIGGGSNTLKKSDTSLKKEFTENQVKIFNKKYNQNLFNGRFK
jgi:hypothetical protein